MNTLSDLHPYTHPCMKETEEGGEEEEERLHVSTNVYGKTCLNKATINCVISGLDGEMRWNLCFVFPPPDKSINPDFLEIWNSQMQTTTMFSGTALLSKPTGEEYTMPNKTFSKI